MIQPYRQAFNEHFTTEKYYSFLKDIHNQFDYEPPFRIAESPVFISAGLKERLLIACNEIINFVNRPKFKQQTQAALVREGVAIPSEDYTSRFMQLDFGICLDEEGHPVPKLIELQGFPSLYFYQDLLAKKYIEHYDLPGRLSVHPNDLTSDEYIALLREEIVGDTDPKHVVLLEVEPDKQATRIDFLCAEKVLGIKVLCISKLIKRGRELFYLDQLGQKIKILKIYTRVIFDELLKRKDIEREFRFSHDVDVEWVGHPNWFFRISKYTMPLLNGPYIPESHYLDHLIDYPEDLENYVLKPLYSFSGTGVQINVDSKMLDKIKVPGNYILQRKVAYHPIVQTPNEPAKCEIRMMALYNTAEKTTNVVNNVVRLSKGEMVGVKYNKDKDWVGGSIGFFEEDGP